MYAYNILFWKIILPVFLIPLLYFKYFHFCVCYTYINRKNVNRSLISIGVCAFFKLVFLVLLYLKLWFFTFFVASVIVSVDFCIAGYFGFTIYFMKSMLYFDINIPVDGFGISEKVDAMGDAIPGL